MTTPPEELIPEDITPEELEHRKDVQFTLSLGKQIADIVTATRASALGEAATIVERFVENYPEDIFPPDGITVDAHSARVIRRMAPVIAEEIRAAVAHISVPVVLTHLPAPVAVPPSDPAQVGDMVRLTIEQCDGDCDSMFCSKRMLAQPTEQVALDPEPRHHMGGVLGNHDHEGHAF